MHVDDIKLMAGSEVEKDKEYKVIHCGKGNPKRVSWIGQLPLQTCVNSGGTIHHSKQYEDKGSKGLCSK